MDTGIELGTIWAAVGLKLDGLKTGRVQATAEVQGISQALNKLAATAEVSEARIAKAAENKTLQSNLKAQEKSVQQAIEAQKKSFEQAAEAQRKFAQQSASAFGGVAAGVALAGVSVVKMAADFDASMTRVSNNTTMTTSDIAQMKSTVMALGKESGASFDDLAEGFAHITNFGFKASDATIILREAMKSAVATGSSTADTADVLAKALHEFGMSAADAGKAMNVMHLAAALGNETLGQFDEAAGPAMAQAANLGVSLTDVSAAMSALTRHGLDAAESATQVKDILIHMINPSKSAHDELERLTKTTGVDLVDDFSLAGLKAKGFTGVMDDLTRATHGNGQEIYKLIQAQRGGLGAMILAGNGAQDYHDILGQLNDAMAGKIDPTTVAYQRSLHTLNNEIARVTNEIKADFIPAGEKLTPVFEDAIPLIRTTASLLGELLSAFNLLPRPVQELVIGLGALKLGAVGLNSVTGNLAGSTLPALISRFGGVKTGAAEAGVEIAGASTKAGGLLATLKSLTASPFKVQITLAILASAAAAGEYIKEQIQSQILDPTDKASAADAALPISQAFVEKRATLTDDIKNLKLVEQTAKARLSHGPIPQGLDMNDAQALSAKYNLPRLAPGQEGRLIAAINPLINDLTKQLPGINKEIQKARTAENMQRNTVPTAPTTADGMLIAQEAWKKQLDGSAKTFQHQCEGLAHATYNTVTKAYAQVLDHSGGSAKSALAKFQALGLAKPYTPGMALAPGSLLYSNTMGSGDGHVQTIGPKGQRLDQYGVNHFAERNFQFYVPPPGDKTNLLKLGKGGTPVDADTLADLKQRAFEANHTNFENRRYEAKQQYTKDKAVNPKLAKSTYLGMLKEIDADEEKEHTQHYQKVETALERHLKRLQKLQAEMLQSENKANVRVQQAGAVAAKNRLAMKDRLQELADPEGAAFDRERDGVNTTYADNMKAAGASTFGPYSKGQLADFALAGQVKTAGLADIDTRQKQKGADDAAKDQQEADALTKQAMADTTQLNREVWQHAGGDMSAYFKSLRDEADAALAEVQAKYGVGSKTPNAAAVTAAQGAHDAKYAVIGQQQVDDTQEAQAKISRGVEESTRFQYEQHMISLGQYQAFLRQKLASTQEYEAGSTTVLSGEFMRLKAALDESMGESKAKVVDVGATIESTFQGSLERSINHFHSMKSAWKEVMGDMKTMAIEMFAKLASLWATSKLFNGKGPALSFGGGGGNTGGGGGNPLAALAGLFGGQKGGGAPNAAGTPPASGGVTSTLDMIKTAQGGGAMLSAIPMGGGGMGAALGVMGALQGLGALGKGGIGGLQGINGPIGGGQGGGGLGGIMQLASMFGGKGGLMGGLLGHGGMAGMFAHGGLMTGSGALGGLGAAMPWLAGGLLAYSLFKKPLKKLFHFASGGLVPGVGHHDTVPAMLTPGEFVLSKSMMQQMKGGGQSQPSVTHIHVTHNGDVHGHEGQESAAEQMAWMINAQLPTATPGGTY